MVYGVRFIKVKVGDTVYIDSVYFASVFLLLPTMFEEICSLLDHPNTRRGHGHRIDLACLNWHNGRRHLTKGDTVYGISAMTALVPRASKFRLIF